MTKTKRQKMTMEKLARMSQHEFTAIRGEMKDGFDGIRGELKEETGLLRRDMEAGFSAVSHGMKTILEKLNSIQEDVIELHDLRSRIERLEKKVGLSR